MPDFVNFFISDQSQLWRLRDFRTLSVGAQSVSVTNKEPEAGEQGAVDMLVWAASSGGVLTAIRTLPEFLKARKSDISIKTTVKGKTFTLTAKNVDEVMPIIERLLDD